MDNIEKIFREDLIEKKRIALGASHRASSKRGFKGPIKFQVDLLKGNKRKEYIKGSEIKMSNLYDKLENVPSLEEIEKMGEEKARNILITLRTKHKTSDLAKHWGVKAWVITQKLVKKYNLPKLRSNEKQSRYYNKKMIVTNPSSIKKTNNNELEKQKMELTNFSHMIKNGITAILEKVDNTKENSNGLFLKISGEYSGEELSSRLLSLTELAEKSLFYELNITIKELNKASVDNIDF